MKQSLCRGSWHRGWEAWAGWLVVMAIVFSMRAQVVNDGATNTLANITNSIPGDVVVGTNGAFTLLILSDNALLTNSLSGLIGRNAGARSNEVRLLSASARWRMGGDLMAGSTGALSRLTIGNGARVEDSQGWIGLMSSSSNNLAVVTDPGSMWTNRGELRMGYGGSGNQMIISNGAVVVSGNGFIGSDPAANSNTVSISGPGSQWRAFDFYVGNNGSTNRLVVDSGGQLTNRNGYIGFTGRGNSAAVSGASSMWTNALGLTVGVLASANQLLVSSGGVVIAPTLLMGMDPASTNNSLLVDGGTLEATNGSAGGVLEARRGTLTLNAGLIEADQLLMTNTQGFFQFNGGILSVRKSTVTDGQFFRVGNGTNPATFNLAGNGYHDFSGVLAVSISSNAVLTGNGTLRGGFVVAGGGTLSVGASPGKLILTNSPNLQGKVLMEISKNGSALTNDQLQVMGPLTYNGVLAVTNIGGSSLAPGDRFPLFGATSYSGGFSSVTLPALGPGLVWTNKLAVDGSIEVAFDLAQQVALTDVPLRVMASNLTSGNNQRYETPGLDILQGLKPDIVAMQEFNVSNSFGVNTTAALSNMVATTFGPEFSYFRETGYAIPNGIISRYPILASGSWEDHDTGISDRGFAWARIDLPGSNDLYVVSVHLKASSGTSNEDRRTAEAAELKDLITTNFPPNAWIVVAGDMNLYSESEGAITTFRTFLSDSPVPADQNGGTNTNSGRDERYDRVLPSFSMTNALISLVMPSRTYTNGLVFDSRVYTPLSEVSPVQTNDSGALNMQHMGVVKSFNVPSTTTNTTIAAGERFWTNALGGNYNVAANWLGNLLPGAQDSVHFAGSGTYEVHWPGNLPSANAYFDAQSGTVTQTFGTWWGVTNTYSVGRDPAALATAAHTAGALRITNSAGTARLLISEAGSAAYNLNGGDVVADFLMMTNISPGKTGTLNLTSGSLQAGLLLISGGSQNMFNFSGGTLRSRNTAITNLSAFTVGNGVSAATFELLGNGAHVFANGLTMHTNTVLEGSGVITGSLAVQSGGVLKPGLAQSGDGTLVLINSPSLQGTVFMGLSKSGLVLTNTQLQVAAPLTYSGSLIVTNLGPAGLVAGDRFQIFSAQSYSGSFSAISLPTLDAGLVWADRLLEDGSIQVMGPPQLTGMVSNPTNGFVQITGQGAANMTYGIEAATNLDLPIFWQRIGSNTADATGVFQFTDTNAPDFHMRFYRALFP